MNGFLVVVRCGMDDLPVRLFTEKGDAMEFARGSVGSEIERVKKVIVVDSSHFIGTDVFTFRGGLLAEIENVRTFDDEDDAVPL